MWFFSTRLRRWIFTTVAIPLLGKAAHKLGDRVEQKKGPPRLAKSLHQAGNLAGRRAQTAQTARTDHSTGTYAQDGRRRSRGWTAGA